MKTTVLRIRNCDFLTEHLREIKGIETPYVPDECEPVYYNYVVGFKPEALGLDIPPRILRDKVQDAMKAEGVPMGLWQRLPVPAQEIFQNGGRVRQGLPLEMPQFQRGV